MVRKNSMQKANRTFFRNYAYLSQYDTTHSKFVAHLLFLTSYKVKHKQYAKSSQKCFQVFFSLVIVGV